MKQPRSLILAAAGLTALALVLGAPRQSNAQAAAPAPVPAAPGAPATAEEAQELALLAAEITKQQAQILENQKQIDAKLATVAENLRIARIYVSRGGGASK